MPDEVRDNTENFFYPIYHQFLDQFLSEMKGSTLKVFMAIARRVSFSTGVGPITTAQIEGLSGCCHHTTVEAFSELESLGVLTRIMSPGQATTYILNQQNNPRQKLGGVPEELPGDPRQNLGGDPRQKLHSTPGKNCTHIEIKEREREYSTESSSPSPGAALPNYDFGTFKSFYPRHRMSRENEKAARAEWNHLESDLEVKSAIIDHLVVMSSSKEWRERGGKYVPNPQKYLRERRWEQGEPPSRNHRAECCRIWEIFMEVTGEDAKLHKLTDARYEMLSGRWEDAVEKAKGNTPENALKVIRSAIQAYCDHHEAKKLKSLITLERIFDSTENFERWIGEACRAD